MLCLASCGDVQVDEDTPKDAQQPKERLNAFAKSETFHDDWKEENTVVCHVQGEPDNLHPLNGSSATARILNLYLHGFLIVPDPSSTDGFGPGLVETLPKVSEDGLVYTYKLRDAIKWDDGTALSVNDVIFSYKAAACPLVNNPHYKPYALAIKSIVKDAADANTIHVEMTERNIQNIGIPTLFPILQEAVWDNEQVLRSYTFNQFRADASTFDEDDNLRSWAATINDWAIGRKPSSVIGLGPYQFADWKDGQSMLFKLKKNHWSENSDRYGLFDSGFPDAIIFKINRDPASQELEFRTQVYDASESLSRATFTALSANLSFLENYNVAEISSFSYTYMAFNLKPDRVNQLALFTDKKVRRAIAQAIPYDEINRLVYGGGLYRQISPVSHLREEHNDNLKPIEYNLSETKVLLMEAGWVDTDDDKILDKEISGKREPFKFTLNYTVTPKHQKLIAELIAESLYEVGIQCELHPITFALLGEKKRAHSFDAFLSAWAMSASPQDFTQIWHTDSWINHGSNYVGFGSAQSDALIDSIRTTVNMIERARMSKRFQRMVYNEQPYVFLFAGTKRIVAHKRFENVRVFNDRPYIVLNQWKLLEHSVAAFDE